MTVGLPARGKTHISRSLERYLRWLGVKTAVLSLGDYRRKTIGGAKNLPADYFATGLSSRCPGLSLEAHARAHATSTADCPRQAQRRKRRRS